ncbi:hypothetical protein [Paractinoplanes atraurantiacus]|uniref:Uncharacterized protein n=1 Tax=Paractinoplanes atraurantiacus TaxID=1036182 RepID=A0A285INM5_9ACTN|nr:hypothetical protein [Actinoplanes atraurantiacus]SNY49589.1 hypothetical protein SAMN05421748_11056 [Actinoplanes atraurantiacus]
MRRLLIAVGLNLALGVPGIVPIFLVGYFLASEPLSYLGSTAHNPNDTEEMLFLAFVMVVLVVPSLIGWLLVNVGLWRHWNVPALAYWAACVTAFFLPYLVLAVAMGP